MRFNGDPCRRKRKGAGDLWSPAPSIRKETLWDLPEAWFSFTPLRCDTRGNTGSPYPHGRRARPARVP